MENLLFTANTVAPLLLLMSAGFLARAAGLLNDALIKGINQLIFRIFLPVNLCLSILNTPYDTELSGVAFLLIPLGLTLTFALLFLIIPRLEKDRGKIGALIQGCGRSNYAFFGIPLVTMLFPGQDTSLAAMLLVVTVPFYNVYSVIALSVYGGKEVNFRRILLNIARNPLIIACVLGYILWLFRFQPPAFLKTTMNDLSKISTPLALFTLGGAIHFSNARKHLRQLAIGISGKLLIIPLVFVAIGALLGLRGVALASVYIAFGAPTAVSSFPMAQQMGGDGELAAEQVALSSAASILSTFLFVFVMKTLGLV